MYPKVSIIIPIYNAEQYLEQCLNSVVKQTIFDKLEIIAVNDGSSDNSQKILNRFSSKYPNIKVINQSNKGIAIARQTGYKNISGKYFAYLDDDDFVDPTMYETLLQYAEKEDADYVYCNYAFYPKAVATKSKWFKKFEGKVDWNFIERNTQPWNKLIRRDLAERIRITELLPQYSDSVYVDLLLHASKIVCVDKELYNYRVGHASVSGSYKGKLQYYLEVAQRAKAQERFLDDIHDRRDLKQYFEYRYIYSLIQVCCVSAVNDNEKQYKKTVHELKKISYKKNPYTNIVLKNNYGKLKAYILKNIIPANYYIAKRICKKVFSS